ncbi:MAG: hypothetical protein KDD56_04890 [Bdellovibrionales bacterium]|nr:hypothetical protein [Bdellovibrionales bacterium]
MRQVFLWDFIPRFFIYSEKNFYLFKSKFNSQKKLERGSTLVSLSVLAVVFLVVLISVTAYLSPNQAGDLVRRTSLSSGAGKAFTVGNFPVLTMSGATPIFRQPGIVKMYMQRDLKDLMINTKDSFEFCLSLVKFNPAASNLLEIVAPYHYRFDENSIDNQLSPCPIGGLSPFAETSASSVFQDLSSSYIDIESKILAVAFVPEYKIAFVKFADVDSMPDFYNFEPPAIINVGSSLDDNAQENNNEDFNPEDQQFTDKDNFIEVANPELNEQGPDIIKQELSDENIIEVDELNQEEIMARYQDQFINNRPPSTENDLIYDGGLSNQELPSLDIPVNEPPGIIMPPPVLNEGLSLNPQTLQPAFEPSLGLNQSLLPEIGLQQNSTPFEIQGVNDQMLIGSRYDLGISQPGTGFSQGLAPQMQITPKALEPRGLGASGILN